jgi:hypothetical protein
MEPDIIFCLPLPNAELGTTEVHAACSALSAEGKRFELRAISDYPCSSSWAELILTTATGGFVGGVVATHYLEKILNVFDAFAIKTIKTLNLWIRSGHTSVSCNIPLREKERAIELLYEAFLELHILTEHSEATVFWLRDATKSEEGVITFNCTKRNGKSRITIMKDSPDYSFYEWLIRERRPFTLISDAEVAILRKEHSQISANS